MRQAGSSFARTAARVGASGALNVPTLPASRKASSRASKTVSALRDGRRLCRGREATFAGQRKLSEWNRLDYAESRYSEREPWEYSERGVERLRHARIAELARSFHAKRTLDLGCSLGQLTGKLAELPAPLFAADLSPTAVTRARENIQAARGPIVEFVAARSVSLPFKGESFDLIIASDGLYSWDLEREDRAAAIVEIHRSMSVGGSAIFTDHMRRNRFREFVTEIESSALHVESVSFLYDRLAYQFESWFKGVRGSRISKAVLRSTNVAMVLSQIARAFGQRGSRHICVVARKA